ncbi:hypothetical protein R1538_34875 [Rhizobium leguminosarum]|uniref:hypothetical protein n=1 Tax=Rhizobium leguminosarum TaxID=384 RepID=UPI00293DC79D|nr:hypothetical protein [Rhizobium leguminosarum]MDV4166237.1 hypothetical protein [Rhizobium leguminosarum]
MNEKIISHTVRYPHARATTIQYLAKRDEMTERLRQEATISYQREAANRLPKRRWSLLAWILGR